MALKRMRRLFVRTLRIAGTLTHAIAVWRRSKFDADNRYRFRLTDALLFAYERSWTTVTAEVQQSIPTDFVKISVSGTTVFWPADLPWTGLPWMHREINVPYWRNPSTYSHPKVMADRFDWVVDGGCCEGYFAEYLLKRHNTARVICLEARADLAAALRLTFRQEIDEGRCQIEQTALSHSAERGRMISSVHLPWETRLSDSCIDLDDSATFDEGFEDVQTSTIDAIVVAAALSGHGMIKLDVEGSEMDVLSGASKTLAVMKPRLSVAVYHGQENAQQCTDLILGANPAYRIRLRGMYAWADRPRPYMLYAW